MELKNGMGWNNSRDTFFAVPKMRPDP